ncbi:YbaK/EbsC family protein [uncultured Bifidobacterium sp.]|uniref:YbaK/EbsC family protein n=1 Tax=uncultured Bifidobacterium sp. TaxID=165187 RepID=UPI00262197B7|nr:YbaK/EbsC family protein [uncultured Bifidobacterium sp.]
MHGMDFGRLAFHDFDPSADAALVAPSTAKAAPAVPGLRVAAIDPELSDTDAFCEHYDIGPDVTGNCIIVEGRHAGVVSHAAVVVAGDARADINGIVRRALHVHKLSFAPMEAAVELTGMEYGGITPVGLPAEWPILVDEKLAVRDEVLIGSGLRASKILLPGSSLAALPGAVSLALRRE